MRTLLVLVLTSILSIVVPFQVLAVSGTTDARFQADVRSYSQLDDQARTAFKDNLFLSINSYDVGRLKSVLVTLGKNYDKEIIEELWSIIGVLDGDSAAQAIMEVFIEHDFSVSERFHAALKRRFGEIAGIGQFQQCLKIYLNPQSADKVSFAHGLLEKAKGAGYAALLLKAFYEVDSFNKAKAIYRLLALQNSAEAYEACLEILENLEDDTMFSNDQEKFLIISTTGMFSNPELKSMVLSSARSQKYWKKVGVLRTLGNYAGDDVVDFLQSLYVPPKKSGEPKKPGQILSRDEMLQGYIQNSLSYSKRKTQELKKKPESETQRKSTKPETRKYDFRKLSGLTLDELAHEYRPLIRLSSGGSVNLFEANAYKYTDYMPMAVEEVCNNSSKMPKLVKDTINHNLSDKIDQLGDYDSSWHLDFSPLWAGATVESGYRSLWNTDTPTPTVYWYAWHNTDKVFPYAIQYWFFYFYNDWTNNHPGDWETITIFLDINGHAKEAVYSTHNEANRYWYSSIWQEANGHPHVYVSNGGHGSYGYPGETPYFCYLGTDYHQGNREIFGPADSSHEYGDKYIGDYDSNFTYLDIDNIAHWMHFGGQWGDNDSDSFGFSAPKGPKLRTDASSPTTWNCSKNPPSNPDTCDERYATHIFGENGNGPWEWAEGYFLGTTSSQCVIRPELTSPSGTTTTNPVFQWNTQDDFFFLKNLLGEDFIYKLYIFDSEYNPYNSAEKSCSEDPCSYQFSDVLNLFEAGQTYYWAARRISGGISSWTDLMEFSIPEDGYYKVEASITPAGSGLAEGHGEFADGETATLKASALHGYSFLKWTGDDGFETFNSDFTITVEQDWNFTAHFGPDPMATAHLSIITNHLESIIYIDGVPHDVGSLDRNIREGTYRISFSPLLGYKTPDPRIIVIQSEEQVDIQANYVPNNHGLIEGDDFSIIGSTCYDGGDGDNIIENQENAGMKLKLEADESAINIEATLSCATSDATVSDDYVYFDNMQAGTSGWSVDWFRMNFDCDLEPEETKDVEFTVYVTYTKNDFQYYQELPFLAPVSWAGDHFTFEVLPNYTIDDDPAYQQGNNGNGVFEGGEAVKIRPKLKNKGPVSATNVDLKLFCDTSHGYVNSGAESYPDLSPWQEDFPFGETYFTAYANANFQGTFTCDAEVRWEEGTSAYWINDALDISVSPAPWLSLNKNKWDFGTRSPGQIVTYVLSVANGGTLAFNFQAVTTADENGSPATDTSINVFQNLELPITLEPGEAITVTIDIDTADLIGNVLRDIKIQSTGRTSHPDKDEHLIITGQVSEEIPAYGVPGSGAGADSPDVSGTTIVWVENNNIFSYDLKSREKHTIISYDADEGGLGSLRISGAIVAWEEWRNWPDGQSIIHDIYYKDMESGQEGIILNDNADKALLGVDGNFIVYKRKEGDILSDSGPYGIWNIYVYDLNNRKTSNPIKITNHVVNGTNPVKVIVEGDFSQDILSWSERSFYWDVDTWKSDYENNEMWSYNITTQEKTNLGAFGSGDYNPSCNNGYVLWNKPTQKRVITKLNCLQDTWFEGFTAENFYGYNPTGDTCTNENDNLQVRFKYDDGYEKNVAYSALLQFDLTNIEGTLENSSQIISAKLHIYTYRTASGYGHLEMQRATKTWKEEEVSSEDNTSFPTFTGESRLYSTWSTASWTEGINIPDKNWITNWLGIIPGNFGLIIRPHQQNINSQKDEDRGFDMDGSYEFASSENGDKAPYLMVEYDTLPKNQWWMWDGTQEVRLSHDDIDKPEAVLGDNFLAYPYDQSGLDLLHVEKISENFQLSDKKTVFGMKYIYNLRCDGKLLVWVGKADDDIRKIYYAVIHQPDISIEGTMISVSNTQPDEQEPLEVTVIVQNNSEYDCNSDISVNLYGGNPATGGTIIGTEKIIVGGIISNSEVAVVFDDIITPQNTNAEEYQVREIWVIAETDIFEDSTNNLAKTEILVTDNDTSPPTFWNLRAREFQGDGDGLIGDDEKLSLTWAIEDSSGISHPIFLELDGVHVPLINDSDEYVIIDPLTAGSHWVSLTATDADNSPETAFRTFSFDVVNSETITVVRENGELIDQGETLELGEFSEGITQDGVPLYIFNSGNQSLHIFSISVSGDFTPTVLRTDQILPSKSEVFFMIPHVANVGTLGPETVFINHSAKADDPFVFYITAEVSSDVDGDGLIDLWEKQIVDHQDTDMLLSCSDVLPDDDYDNDGFSNRCEFDFDSDPTDAQSKPILKGDLDWNGRVDFNDALIALNVTAGNKAAAQPVYLQNEIGGNGLIDLEEALFALCAIADLVEPVYMRATYQQEVIDLTAQSNYNQVTLTWQNPTDDLFSEVRIVRKMIDCPSGPEDGTIIYEGPGQSFIDTDLADGTYCYAVFAHDSFRRWSHGRTAEVDIVNRITNSIGMEFVSISHGTFMMGSPDSELGRVVDEIEHQVTLTQNFYMQTTEVTQGQWFAVMGTMPSSNSACGDDCPVENVSWYDVQAFIQALNLMENTDKYRLPTEAEWEYSCRAGSVTAFANGGITALDCNFDSNLDAMGWYCGNPGDATHPVAQKSANAWGLYDMHGNVREWCQDWIGDYPSESVTDPTGPLSSNQKAHRGGDWAWTAWHSSGTQCCRSADRNCNSPGDKLNSLGFRLAMSDTITNAIGQKFAYIPPETFTMGSPDDEPGRDVDGRDETQHEVTLTQGFYMMTTEVTQGQWHAIMGNNPSQFVNCGNDCPVEQVSWDDVQAFIQALNLMENTDKYRLPTEAEWEYSCRAGSVTAFANGGITELTCGLDSNLNTMGWYCGNSEVEYAGCLDFSGMGGASCAGTQLVGLKQPNAWGLYDMHGNVYEWCQDWYGDFPSGNATDPTGPTSGTTRITRGGSWRSRSHYCRSAFRQVDLPSTTYNGTGFRLVISK